MKEHDPMLRLRSFGTRNVHLTFLSPLLISSLFCFNSATFGQPANEEAYRSALTRGQSQLDKSYELGASADRKGKEATDAGKVACPAKNDALETSAKPINEEAKRLVGEAKAFAKRALGQFSYAETLIPGRPEAIFGEGLALLQLNEHCAAIKKIESVRGANYRTAETTFALGNALVDSSDVGSREFQTGIELLTDYIKQAEATGNPQAFRNYEIATKLIGKAGERRQDLVKKNEQKEAEPNFAPCPMPTPGKTELPFTASISSAIGYNDNVIVLGRGLSLPAGVAQKASLYNESSFALGRDFSFSHASSLSSTGWLSDKLSLKYIFLADTFEEFPERDRLLHTVLGSYQWAFTPKMAGFLKVSDQWLYIDQSISSNVFTAQEALVLTLNARWRTLLSYYLIRNDGFAPSTTASNPDGYTHRAELAQSFVLMQDRDDFSAALTLSGQYGHEWNQPSGIAGRFQRDDLLGKLEWKVFHARNRCSFIRGVTMAISDRWQPDRYTHALFRSSPTTGLFARAEDTNILALAMSLTMWHDQSIGSVSLPEANRLEVNFDYRHTTRDSNVQSKTYGQNLFLVSLKLNY